MFSGQEISSALGSPIRSPRPPELKYSYLNSCESIQSDFKAKQCCVHLHYKVIILLAWNMTTQLLPLFYN